MKLRKPIAALLASVALSAAGIAYAGPSVTITIKNLGSETATYTITDYNTDLNASPKPNPTVWPGQSNTYTVSSIWPSITTAAVQYRIGSKSCGFITTYMTIPGLLGSTPKWSKSFNAANGAVCNATITSINMSTHAWHVEFTIK